MVFIHRRPHLQIYLEAALSLIKFDNSFHTLNAMDEARPMEATQLYMQYLNTILAISLPENTLIQYKQASLVDVHTWI